MNMKKLTAILSLASLVAGAFPAFSVQAAPADNLERKLAELCVDAYRKHLAYPDGVMIFGKTLEPGLNETQIYVDVQTFANPATPARINPIIIRERFICVTDGSTGLNERSTSFFTERHKRGERL